MTQTARRLTRHEQQAQTRLRLIETADRMFAEGGIKAASLRSLCERAGFSQGAFYSNFASKEDLLLCVLERHIQQEVAFMQGLVSGSDREDLDDALDRLANRLAKIARDPHWSLLSAELQLHARRDPDFAARGDKVKAASLNEFTALLEDLIKRYNLNPAITTPDLARGLYALWSGLALQGSTRGELPRDQVFLSFLRNMIGSPRT
ncbi:TetR/AcrR family transcriptional regulator [Marinobacter zhanjiangensis]|uniref:TetR family transcriptional regulator n=1 Tax=Marinobacter zhanjiangensis TaxID=578215 RepID=A0ABQ3AMZ0_9GAMM|nr:TetR/AcrR family transcriptional regulator [Marinobacter zhanjiangensis]GGY57976.1 TetR family transcriptional regulator [Marinobacter zhanjiangensis]